METMDDDIVYTNVEVGDTMAESERASRSVSMHPRRKRKKTSRCWSSFTELPMEANGKARAKCTKCGVEYMCDGGSGTTNLLRHQLVCGISGNMVSPRSAVRSSNFQHEKFQELVIKAIIQHDLPFSFVGYDGIRDVFDYISSSFKLPCRNTVKSHVIKLYETEKSSIKTMLSGVRGRICLTSDLWSSNYTDGYLTLTAHFLNSEWKLYKRILSFCHMPPPHNGISLSEKINSLICEWEIDENLFSITLDNASANDSFVEKLRAQLNFRGLLLQNGKFFHVRCCAHILNLIVQDGLKSIDGSVLKVHECIKYIKGSMLRKDRFKGCIDQVGLGRNRRSLRQDVPTRWNSTYLMLDSALYYRRALLHFQLVDPDFKCCPTDEEWEKIEIISKFLGYFYDVTCLFSGTKYPTSNLFFPKVFMIQHKIKQAMENQNSFMRQMALDMNSKFEKYWSDYSLILGIAVVLDPCYKMQLVDLAHEILYGPFSEEFADFKRTLTSIFDVYVEKNSNPNDTSFMSHNSQPEDEDAMLKEFDDRYKNRSGSSVKTELYKYLDEDRLDRWKELDILAWRKMQQFRYPILSRLAGDMLTIPISTVAFESAFSVAGRVLDQYRSCLLPETVEALLCTRDWLFGKRGQDQVDLEQLTEDIAN